MKIRHKTPADWTPRPDPEWSERVEREAERHTTAAEYAHAKAQARLHGAKRRHGVEAAKARPNRKRLHRLADVVEARRQELLALERAMQQAPGGKQKHRPVPDQTRF